MKRVVHVITGLETGGAERMLVNFLRSAEGVVDHSVISLTSRGMLAEEIEDLGIAVDTLNMRRGHTGLEDWWKLYRGFHARVTKENIVHGWMYHANMAAVMSGHRGPIIWSIHHALHDMGGETVQLKRILRLLKVAAIRARAIVYCSHVSAKQHEEFGFPTIKTRVIPNGIDCELYVKDRNSREETRKELEIDEDAFVIGHVGRYHPVKDHDTLLKAAAGLKDRIPGVVIVMVGNRVDWGNQSLVRRVEEMNLKSSVRMIGLRKDIHRVINAMDVLTLTSKSEAFPNVLCEAMACGVPCVATEVGDAAEIVGTTGRLVRPKGVDQIIEECSDLARLGWSERQRLGARARERIMERFRLEKMREKYLELYEEM